MRGFVWIAFCLAPMLAGPAAALPSFAGLGDLSGGVFRSYAYAISADSSTVVGYSTTASGNRAFRWTEAGGMENLGSLDGGHSYAYGVSEDGSTVVGGDAGFFHS